MVGGSAFTLTVTGSKFMAGTVVRWNGASRPTTFVSATQLQASIGAGDIVVAGSANVTVYTPAPGGGVSAPLAFTIRDTPALAVSATSIQGGSALTVTLTNGLGGSGDWLAFAVVGAANNSYVQYTYVGNGVSTRTWTITAPPTSGTYEFRLFENYGYTRLATSPAVTGTSRSASHQLALSGWRSRRRRGVHTDHRWQRVHIDLDRALERYRPCHDVRRQQPGARVDPGQRSRSDWHGAGHRV